MIFMFEDVTDPHQTNAKTSLLHPLSHYSFNTTHDFWYHDDDIIWQILALGKTCFAASPRFFAPRRNAPGKVPSLHGSHATGCGDPTVHPSAEAAPSGCRSADSMSGSPAKREISRNDLFFLAPKARRSYLKRKLSRHKIRTEGFTESLTKT